MSVSESPQSEVEEEWSVEQEEIKESYDKVYPSNTVYLSGPMKNEPNEGKVWRDEIKQKFADEFNFLDPYDEFAPEDGEIVCDSELEDPDNQILSSEVVRTDKNMIYGSDYVFVGLSDVISRGTCMEMIYAYSHDIPVFLWDRCGDKKLSPWVVYHCVYRSTDRDKVVEAMSNWE